MKEQSGIQQIKDNLHKSFFGTFNDALKNGYVMDKHYVIVDWKFFFELLLQEDINKLASAGKRGKTK